MSEAFLIAASTRSLGIFSDLAFFIAILNLELFSGSGPPSLTAIEISLGAIEEKKFPAKLNFIAPKGTEEGGAVQFTIKANITLDDNYFVRANYSANADIVLEKQDSVLSIKEALLRFDKKTEKPYVEIKIGDNEFEKRELELGISDGVNIMVKSGITEADDLKIWNKARKDYESDDDPRRN